MEWWSKLKQIMGVPEDEFMTDDLENEDSVQSENKRDQFFSSKYNREDNNSYENFTDKEPTRYESRREVRRETRPDFRREVRKSRDEKYVNINATAQLQVILVKPEDFSECPQIADHLTHKKTVLLNVEGVDKDVVRRMIDFLSGVAYAQGGTLKRVANGTFIITPYDVDIMGDVLDELKMDRVTF